MKQEDKDLLLKDLCARMPYDVYARRYVYTTPTDAIESVELFDLVWLKELYAEEAEFKPYLFPLSSMTEEQKEEYCQLQQRVIYNSKSLVNEDVTRYVDWLNKNHFDYKGLTEKGLAIDATGLNIY
jgi:hypothetical protein